MRNTVSPPLPPNAFVGGKRKQHVFKQAVELENEGLWSAAPPPASCFRQEIVERCPTPRQGTSPLAPMKGGNVIFPPGNKSSCSHERGKCDIPCHRLGLGGAVIASLLVQVFFVPHPMHLLVLSAYGLVKFLSFSLHGRISLRFWLIKKCTDNLGMRWAASLWGGASQHGRCLACCERACCYQGVFARFFKGALRPCVFCCSLLVDKADRRYARGAADKTPSTGFNLHASTGCIGVKPHGEALACAGGELLVPETIA